MLGLRLPLPNKISSKKRDLITNHLDVLTAVDPRNLQLVVPVEMIVSPMIAESDVMIVSQVIEIKTNSTETPVIATDSMEVIVPIPEEIVIASEADSPEIEQMTVVVTATDTVDLIALLLAETAIGIMHLIVPVEIATTTASIQVTESAPTVATEIASVEAIVLVLIAMAPAVIVALVAQIATVSPPAIVSASVLILAATVLASAGQKVIAIGLILVPAIDSTPALALAIATASPVALAPVQQVIVLCSPILVPEAASIVAKKAISAVIAGNPGNSAVVTAVMAPVVEALESVSPLPREIVAMVTLVDSLINRQSHLLLNLLLVSLVSLSLTLTH